MAKKNAKKQAPSSRLFIWYIYMIYMTWYIYIYYIWHDIYNIYMIYIYMIYIYMIYIYIWYIYMIYIYMIYIYMIYINIYIYMNTCGHAHSAVLSQLGYCVILCPLDLQSAYISGRFSIVPAEASKKGSSWEISDTPRDKDEEQSGGELRSQDFPRTSGGFELVNLRKIVRSYDFHWETVRLWSSMLRFVARQLLAMFAVCAE